MAPEKQTRLGTGMTMKQKATIVVFIVILLIIIWQLIGLFSNGSPSTPARPPVQAQRTAPTGGAAPPGPSGMAAAPIASNGQQSVLNPATVENNELLKAQEQTQGQYLETLSQLEQLRIQRQIAEANQAIATARLATVTAEKKISDLLTAPAIAPVPVQAYTQQLGGNAPTENPPGVPGNVVPADQYTVISVFMSQNRWNAVVGYQGHLYNVSIGDVLPPEGWVVRSINKNGITLRKDGQETKVSMVSAL